MTQPDEVDASAADEGTDEDDLSAYYQKALDWAQEKPNMFIVAGAAFVLLVLVVACCCCCCKVCCCSSDGEMQIEPEPEHE